MKPLNRDEPGCNYTSSNCVIWQGPDIPCINLCKGDSVSDVIAKLATELCDVLEILDVSTYDISCLNLACAPANFHDFLQILITTICNLQGGQAPSAAPSDGQFSDTVIPVAPCFYYTNSFGDQVTTMTITDYVNSIGNRICNLETRVTVVETTTAQHTTQIQTLETQMAAVPANSEQTMVPYCVLPPVETSTYDVLVATELKLCQLEAATGTSAQLYAAILQQCSGLGASQQLAGTGGNMQSIPGWDSTLLTVAAAINNIWLTICDMRASIVNIQKSCCPIGCDGVALNLTTTISGLNLTIYVGGTIPTGFVNCSTLGSLVTITDGTGGSFITHIDLITFLNSGPGFVIALPAYMNTASDITTVIDACVKDSTTGTTCQSCLEHVILDPATCPAVIYTPGTTNIGFSTTTIPGTATYTLELYNAAGTVLITSNAQLLTYPTPFTGTLASGTINSTLRARLVITAGGDVNTCPFTSVALLPTPLITLNLATAEDFAVLANTGITNSVGASAFIGDVGTVGGVITNIAVPDVTGTLYAVADPIVLTAYADFLNAITDAGTRTYVTLPGDNITGTTITPGYWNTPTGTVSNTANVTFDALGDPGSIFIIKTTTTLIFSAASTITLINGATWDMIFWVIGTTASVGAGSTFHGNILASGNITIAAGSTVDGRILTSATDNIDTSTIDNS